MQRIFFDIDGVLIEGFHTRKERWRRWDEDIEKDIGIKFGHIEDFILRGSFPDILHGRLDFKTELQRWLDAHGYKQSAQSVIDYWHEKDSNISIPVFNVVKKIGAKKSAKLYTATNQSHERIEYLRNTMGWNDHFNDFFYSARLGCLKYDPHYFAQIETILGFDPEKDPPLYFDDDPRNIDVATNRGWNAVLVDGPEDVTTHETIKKLIGA